MASLRWVADGIEVAEAAGGVTLDRYRRPGFNGKVEARPRPRTELQVSGFPIDTDPEPYEDEDRSL